MATKDQATIATVTVDNLIPAVDSSAKFIRGTDKLFTDYLITTHYEKSRHIYRMGITSPSKFQGDSVAFIQLAAPTLLWICDWTASSINKQPEVPNPNPSDPNWVLLDDRYEPASLALAPDGVTPLYRISGTYVYGHKNPDDFTPNNISFPCPPWMDPSGIDRTMPIGKFIGELSNAPIVANIKA